MQINQKSLNDLFSYDELTGVLVWIGHHQKFRNGLVAGTDNGDGYIRVTIDRRPYLAHRLIWLMVHGNLPECIDHINGDGSDNRLRNIRAASKADNCRNRGKNSNNTSGYKGVCLHKPSGKFRAAIRIGDRVISLGHYNSAEDAHNAYAGASLKLHGEFSKAI